MMADVLFWVLAGVVGVLTVLSFFLNPFFRRPRVEEETDEEGESVARSEWPSMSVVIIAHDEAESLNAHLSVILTQQYEGDFDVVVVTEQGDLDTEHVLKQYGAEGRLHTTFIPRHPLFMSRQKLAVSLGVKAARGEWVVLIDADCVPVTDKWLSAMARHCTRSRDVVVGYSNYSEATRPLYRFLRLRGGCYALRRAQRGGGLFSTGANVAFRRAMFIGGDGYRGNLQWICGEYDFIVNKYAGGDNCGAALSRDAVIRQDTPSRKTWRDRSICFESIRRALEGSASYRWLYGLDLWIMYADYLCCIGVGVWAGVTGEWILLSVASVCLVAAWCVRIWMARKAFRTLGERLPVWKVIFYELSIPFRDMYTRGRFLAADKSDFTSHKL